MKKSDLWYALVTATLTLSPSVQAFESANLVKNGDFTEHYESGLPAEWTDFSHPNHLQKIKSSATVVLDENFFRITRKTSDGAQYGQQTVALPSNVESVYVSLRARGRDLVPGDDWWKLPGITFAWISGEQATQIGPGRWLLLKTVTENWVTLETVLEKPQGTTGIRISFQGIGWTGEADFDQVTVEPLQ